MFPIMNSLKQDVLLLLLFKFAFEHAIRKVQANKEGFKLNGTHQLLVYTADVNILGGSIHTVKKNSSLLVTSKMTDPEVINKKTKYMVMYCEHVSLKHALLLEHLRRCNLFVVPGSRQNL